MSPLSIPRHEGDRPQGAVAPAPGSIAPGPSFRRFDPPLGGGPPPLPLTLPSLLPDDPSGAEGEAGGALGFVRRMREAIAASAWATLATRALLLATGIFVLAVVGRLTTTKPARAEGAFDASSWTMTRSIASIASGAPSTSALRPEPSALAPAPPPPSVVSVSTPPTGTRATVEDPVFLNYASVEELRRLPGAGHKRADAIIALRQRIGRFQRVEELLRVKGIGRATIRKWRPLIRLDAPTARPLDAGAG